MPYAINFETDAGHVTGYSFDGMFVPGEPGRRLEIVDRPKDFDSDGHLLPTRVHHGSYATPAAVESMQPVPVDPARIEATAPVAGAGTLILVGSSQSG